MNVIEYFLMDFKENYLPKVFQYGNDVYQGCLNDLAKYSYTYSLVDCDNIYVKANLSNPDYIDMIQSHYGIKLSYYKTGELVNRPTCVKKINGNQYVSSYNCPMRIFDDNQSYLGDFPGLYGNSNNSYQQPRSFDVDLSSNTMYIVCYTTHVVQAFDLLTGNVKFTIGTQNSAGDVSAGKLQNPINVNVLNNGHILITSVSGRGQKDGNNANFMFGHVSEYDSDGTFINTHLQYDTNGEAWRGEVNRPNYCQVDEDNDEVFVVYNTNGYVGRFKLSTWEYITTYTTPTEMSDIIVQATPQTCLVKRETNELIVSNDNPDIITSLDLDTHNLNYYLGKTVQNDRVDQQNIIAGFYSIYDINIYDSTSYIVCDYGNNCVQIVPILPYIPTIYDVNIPENYKVVDEQATQFSYNTDTNTINYTLDQFWNMKHTIYIPLEKIEL